MIRVLAALAFLALAAPAQAASTQADYLAARERATAAIARLEKADAKPERIDAAQKPLLADLLKRLKALVGDVAVAGFPTAGKLAYDTLSTQDVGFGGIDALSFSADEAGPRLVVTTRGLLDHWLSARAADKDAGLRLPADETGAFALDDFYTSALGEDAAFTRTADLPLKRPAGADAAVAKLGGWAQDEGPNPNAMIEVVVIKGGRALFVDAPAKAPAPKIEACEKIWSDGEAAWERFMKAHGDAAKKDDAAFDAANKLHDKAFGSYNACYIARSPEAPGFDKLVAEAQDYADRLAK